MNGPEYITEDCLICGATLTARNDNQSVDWVAKRHADYDCSVVCQYTATCVNRATTTISTVFGLIAACESCEEFYDSH